MWTGVVVSLLTLAARLLIRWKLLAKLKADDWLAMAATALSLASTITYTTISPTIYLMTESDHYIFDYSVDFDDISGVIQTLTNSYLGAYICTWTCLWTIKLSFLAFFHGLGQQIRFQRILWWFIFALTIATYAVCVGLLNYKCMASIGKQVEGKFLTPFPLARAPSYSLFGSICVPVNHFLKRWNANHGHS